MTTDDDDVILFFVAKDGDDIFLFFVAKDGDVSDRVILCSQLFLEFPAVRREALEDISCWLSRRIQEL